MAFYGFMTIIEFTQPSSSNSFSPPGLHWSNVELLNFCSLLRISLITLCQSKISLSERPAYYHHSYQYIYLSSIHLYCYANVIPLTNQSGPLFGGVRSPLFMSPSNFYMSTNTGYWCNSILAIIFVLLLP